MTTNNCNFSCKLSAYLDGELSAGDREAVKAHLVSCADCSEELFRLSALDADLRAIPGIEPAPFFTAKVVSAARAMKVARAAFVGFLRFPVPVAAALIAFIIFNMGTFAFNINAMENGPRRELARKVAVQLVKPASLINPVAVARLCGECSKYLCLCMHETGKKSICPCKDCQMGKMQEPDTTGNAGNMKSMEEHDVH